MSINFGKEYKKFHTEQEKLRKYYISLGMSKEVIDAICEFDKIQFCKDIAFKRRTQYIQASDEAIITSEDKNPLLKNHLEILSVPFDFHTSGRFWWLEEIEDEKLLSGLMRLSENDLEMITYLVFDGYSQVEIAEIKGVSQPSISKKIKKIRKILNDF